MLFSLICIDTTIKRQFCSGKFVPENLLRIQKMSSFLCVSTIKRFFSLVETMLWLLVELLSSSIGGWINCQSMLHSLCSKKYMIISIQISHFEREKEKKNLRNLCQHIGQSVFIFYDKVSHTCLHYYCIKCAYEKCLFID